MSVALILQIITAALQLAPLGITTVAEIKKLLAADPSTPPDLAKILLETAEDNAATLAAVEAWVAANPEV